MALKDKIPALVNYIRANREFIQHNQKIFNILEGDLLKEVEELIDRDFAVKRAAEETKKRVPPINLFARIVQKLSKLYSVAPVRLTENPVDQEIVDWYVKEMNLDSFFADANQYYNSAKVGALRPYLEDVGDEFMAPRLRSYAPQQFLAYSDDKVNPLKVTEFIEYLGTAYDEDDKVVRIYLITSDDEFLVMDENGRVRVEMMLDENGEFTNVNPFGVLPHTYINASRHLLVPKPDSDSLRMATLIPLIIADVNTAIKYLSHSMIIAVDAHLGDVDRNSGAFIELHSGTDEKGNPLKPDVKTVDPTVDVDKVIKLVNYEVAMWLEARNVKPGTAGKTTAENAASGTALIVQNADTTENRKQQGIYFEQVEQEFWQRMKIIHNRWAREGKIEERRLFSDDFEVRVQYAELKPIEGHMEKIEKLKGLKEIGLFSREFAVRELYPHWNEEEIDAFLNEVDDTVPTFRLEENNG